MERKSEGGRRMRDILITQWSEKHQEYRQYHAMQTAQLIPSVAIAQAWLNYRRGDYIIADVNQTWGIAHNIRLVSGQADS